MREFVNRSADKIKLAYVIFLVTIIMVVIGSQLVIQYGLDQQNDDAKNISLAARQIMLSQRISKLAMYIDGAARLGNSTQLEHDLDTLSKISSQWKSEYNALLVGTGTGRNTPRVDKLLRENALRLDTIIVACNSMIQNPYALTISNSINTISKMESPFREKMEEIVQTYKIEAESKLSNIKRIELILSALALVVIILEFFFIFFPLIKKQYEDNRSLALITGELTLLNKKLEESERKLKLISENSTDLICLVTPSGKYLYVSPSLKAITGYELSEIDSRDIKELIHPDDLKALQAEGSNLKMLKVGEPLFNIQVRFRHRDGCYLWIETNLKPLMDEHKQVYAIQTISRDITSRKETEFALAAAKEKAENATQAKSDFLSSMTHELRTPLNGVIGFIDLLKNTHLAEIQQQYVKIISQSATGLLDVINDILDFSKIEAGKLSLAPEFTSVKELSQQVCDMVSYQANQKKLKVVLLVEEKISTQHWVDPVRLRQVLINLMSNAIKFTEKGEVKLTVDLVNQPAANKQTLKFAVTDTGIGIKAENQDKIFKAFSQEDSSITKKFGGTGLGLAISNRLLDLMKSRLQLISKAGAGSAFFFEVTMQTNDIIINPVSDTSIPSTTDYEKKDATILIAEDNEVNMMLIKIMLENIMPEAKLVEATNGKVAVDLYNSTRPDLVFMDIQMPEMNGYQAATEIRKQNEDWRAPIIALTAGTVKGEKERCIEAGMSDYITKPIVQDSIKAVLSKWLA